MWDTYGPPTPGFAEQCYFLRLHGDRRGNTVVALADAEDEAAATIRFSTKQLPAFTIWKNTAAERDGYVTGLEPGTDYPNPRRFERSKGRVIELSPAETYEAKLGFGIVAGAEAVGKLRDEIAGLVEGKEGALHDAPDPEYCPM